MRKKAIIFGVTGQDGSYLSEFLLKKKYIVHGVKRRSSSTNTERLDHIFDSINFTNNNFFLHYGDITDSGNIFRLINQIKPDEIYNLAAQSHVKVSFELPEYTANSTALGALRILEAIRTLGLAKKIKYYQASSSEMFGKIKEKPQTERTTFYPRSIYGISKVFAHHITINYREAYGIFASTGILFNHESPRRGPTFVTRKIVKGLVRIKLGKQKFLRLGNLYAKRDWGHARDYVESMWKILQLKKPDDFLVCTSKQMTVKQFINLCANELGINLLWKNKGLKEVAIDKNNNKTIIKIDKKYFRETEVDDLVGKYTKAKKILNWKPKTSINELIKEITNSDLNEELMR